MPTWTKSLMVDISEQNDVSINALEFLALLIPLHILTDPSGKARINNTCIKWMCDNKSALFWVRKEKAKSLLPALLVYIFNGISRTFRLRHSIRYVKSCDNKVADGLSIGETYKFNLDARKRVGIDWSWVNRVLNYPDTVWERPVHFRS